MGMGWRISGGAAQLATCVGSVSGASPVSVASVKRPPRCWASSAGGGGGLAQKGAGAHHIVDPGDPGVIAALGDRQRLLGHGDRAPRHRDLQPRRADRDIGLCRGRRDIDPRQIERRLRRPDIGLPGLDRAFQPPEQVEIVGDALGPGIGKAGLQRDGRALGVARGLPVGRVERQAGLRRAGKFRPAQGGLRLLQAGQRDTQIGVVGERLLLQPIEQRVVVEPPPARRQRALLVIGGIARAEEGGGRRVPACNGGA
jgi:hypothetical protein